MLSSQENPKVVAEWLELDYFRRRRRLARVRRLLVCVAFLLGPAVFAYTLLPGRRTAYESAPVSQAHAFFNADCDRCHQESFGTAARLATFDNSLRSVSDDTCRHCHDGPVHHATQQVTPACATCHREHQGKASLVATDDGQCTSCHAALTTRTGTTPFATRITRFDTDHPPFGQWRGGQTPPRQLRFSHHTHTHLSAEMIKDRDWMRAPLARLAGQACTACHEAGPAPPAEGGLLDVHPAYMRPVSYERHCAVCHPLGVPLAGVEDAKVPAAAAFRQKPAPHPLPGESAATVRAALRERLLTFARQSPAVLQPGSAEPARPLPGRRRAEPVTESALAWANGQLDTSERVLFDGPGGCRYCHTETTTTGRRPDGLPAYAVPQTPARWFPHARFNHSTHRLLTCTACHPDGASSGEAARVSMPTIDACRSCHADGKGARTDCALCHLYHDRAKDRGLAGKLTIDDALHGSGR